MINPFQSDIPEDEDKKAQDEKQKKEEQDVVLPSTAVIEKGAPKLDLSKGVVEKGMDLSNVREGLRAERQKSQKTMTVPTELPRNAEMAPSVKAPEMSQKAIREAIRSNLAQRTPEERNKLITENAQFPTAPKEYLGEGNVLRFGSLTQPTPYPGWSETDDRRLTDKYPAGAVVVVPSNLLGSESNYEDIRYQMNKYALSQFSTNQNVVEKLARQIVFKSWDVNPDGTRGEEYLPQNVLELSGVTDGVANNGFTYEATPEFFRTIAFAEKLDQMGVSLDGFYEKYNKVTDKLWDHFGALAQETDKLGLNGESIGVINGIVTQNWGAWKGTEGGGLYKEIADILGLKPEQWIETTEADLGNRSVKMQTYKPEFVEMVGQHVKELYRDPLNNALQENLQKGGYTLRSVFNSIVTGSFSGSYTALLEPAKGTKEYSTHQFAVDTVPAVALMTVGMLAPGVGAVGGGARAVKLAEFLAKSATYGYLGWGAFTGARDLPTVEQKALLYAGMFTGVLGQKAVAGNTALKIFEGTSARAVPAGLGALANIGGAGLTTLATLDAFKREDGTYDMYKLMGNFTGDLLGLLASDIPDFYRAVKTAVPDNARMFNQFVYDTDGNTFGFITGESGNVRMVRLTEETLKTITDNLKKSGVEPKVIGDMSPTDLQAIRTIFEPNLKQRLTRAFFGDETAIQQKVNKEGYINLEVSDGVVAWKDVPQPVKNQAPTKDRSFVILDQLNEHGSLSLEMSDMDFVKSVDKLVDAGLAEVKGDNLVLTKKGQSHVKALEKKAMSALNGLREISDSVKAKLDPSNPLYNQPDGVTEPPSVAEVSKEAGKGVYAKKYVNGNSPVDITPLEYGSLRKQERDAIAYAIGLGKLQVQDDGTITRTNYESSTGDVKVKFGYDSDAYTDYTAFELGKALTEKGDKRTLTKLRKELADRVGEKNVDELGLRVYKAVNADLEKIQGMAGDTKIEVYKFHRSKVISPDPEKPVTTDTSKPDATLPNTTTDGRPAETVATTDLEPAPAPKNKLPDTLLIQGERDTLIEFKLKDGIYYDTAKSGGSGIPYGKMLKDIQNGDRVMLAPKENTPVETVSKKGFEVGRGFEGGDNLNPATGQWFDNYANPANDSGFPVELSQSSNKDKFSPDRPWREGEKYRYEMTFNGPRIAGNPALVPADSFPNVSSKVTHQNKWVEANRDYMLGKSDTISEPLMEGVRRTFDFEEAQMTDAQRAVKYSPDRPWNNEISRPEWNEEKKRIDMVKNPSYKDPANYTDAEIQKAVGNLAKINNSGLASTSTDAEKLVSLYSKKFNEAFRSGDTAKLTEVAVKMSKDFEEAGIKHRINQVYEIARSLQEGKNDQLFMTPSLRKIAIRAGLGKLFGLPSFRAERAFYERNGYAKIGGDKVDMSHPMFQDGAKAELMRSKSDPTRFYANPEAMKLLTQQGDSTRHGLTLWGGKIPSNVDVSKFPELQGVLGEKGTATIVNLGSRLGTLSDFKTAIIHEKVHQILIDAVAKSPELKTAEDILNFRHTDMFNDGFETIKKVFSTEEGKNFLNYLRVGFRDEGTKQILSQYGARLKMAEGDFVPVEQMGDNALTQLATIAHEVLAYGTNMKSIQPLVGSTGVLGEQARIHGSKMDATESIFAGMYVKLLEGLKEKHGEELANAVKAYADSDLQKYVKNYEKYTRERNIGLAGAQLIESAFGRYPSALGGLGDAQNGGFRSSESKSAEAYDELNLLPKEKYDESIASLRAGTGTVHLRDDLTLDASHPIFGSTPAEIEVDGKSYVNEAYELAMTKTWHGSGAKELQNKGGLMTDFIGSGEGSQAFGWGHYVADVDDTARVYWKIASNNGISVVVDGEPLSKALQTALARSSEPRFAIEVHNDLAELLGSSFGVERFIGYPADLILEGASHLKDKSPEAFKRLEDYIKSGKEIYDIRPGTGDFIEEELRNRQYELKGEEDFFSKITELSSPDIYESTKAAIESLKKDVAILDKMVKNPESIEFHRDGALYRTMIKPDLSEFMDLDKPLSGQSEHVQKALDEKLFPSVQDKKALTAFDGAIKFAATKEGKDKLRALRDAYEKENSVKVSMRELMADAVISRHPLRVELTPDVSDGLGDVYFNPGSFYHDGFKAKDWALRSIDSTLADYKKGVSVNADYFAVQFGVFESVDDATIAKFRQEFPEYIPMLEASQEFKKSHPTPNPGTGLWPSGARILSSKEASNWVDNAVRLKEKYQRISDFRKKVAESENYGFKISNPMEQMNMHQILKIMEREHGPRTYSEMLLQAGIRGNQFYDRASRADQSGTKNYVIFQDADVSILKEVRGKYVLPDFKSDPENAYKMLTMGLASPYRLIETPGVYKEHVAYVADETELAMQKKIAINYYDVVEGSFGNLADPILGRNAMKLLDEYETDRLLYQNVAQIYREMYEVDVVRDSLGRLLAPNGQVSNLPETMYRKVRTPTFKLWFGDWENDPMNASKIVDENGEPLVLWHGTVQGDFFKFLPSASASGYIYSTRDIPWASHFARAQRIGYTPVDGRLYPLFARVFSPMDFTETGKGLLTPESGRLNSYTIEEARLLSPFRLDGSYIGNAKRYSIIKDSGFIRSFVNSRFDGIIQLEESAVSADKVSRVLAVTDPSVYKSAMSEEFKINQELMMSPRSGVAQEMLSIKLMQNSDGDLIAPNGKKSNLNENLWRVVRTPSFLRFFGDWMTKTTPHSVVLDENGEPKVFYHGNNLYFHSEEQKISKMSINQILSGNFDPNRLNISLYSLDEEIKSFYDMTHFGNIAQASDFVEQHFAAQAQGHIYPVFLNIRNPIRLEDRGYGDWRNEEKVAKAIAKTYPDREKELMGLYRATADNMELLKATDHDGIVYVNRAEGLTPEDRRVIHYMPNVSQVTDEFFTRNVPSADFSFVPLTSKGQVKSTHSAGFDPAIDDIMAMTPKKSGEYNIVLRRLGEDIIPEGMVKGDTEFHPMALPRRNVTAKFNLANLSDDPLHVALFESKQFAELEKVLTEKGYDGYFDESKMGNAIATFRNLRNSTAVSEALDSAETELSMSVNRLRDVTYRLPEDQTASTVKTLLERGNVSVIAGKNLDKLKKALDDADLQYLPIESDWFEGLAVYYPFPNTSSIVDYIASKQGQESVIHSLGGKVTQRYVSGKFAGTEMTSLGADNSIEIKTKNGKVPLEFLFNHKERKKFKFQPLIAENRLKAQQSLRNTSVVTPMDVERLVRGNAKMVNHLGEIVSLDEVTDAGGKAVGQVQVDSKGAQFVQIGDEKVYFNKRGVAIDSKKNKYYYSGAKRDLLSTTSLVQSLMMELNPRVKLAMTPEVKASIWEKNLHGLLDKWFESGYKGEDWYESEVAKFAEEAGKTIPDVKTDIGQLTLFLLTALTSGGNKVKTNAIVALDIMAPLVHYFETGKLFLPEYQGRIAEDGSWEIKLDGTKKVQYTGAGSQASMSKFEALSKGYISANSDEGKLLVKAGAKKVSKQELFGDRFPKSSIKNYVKSPTLEGLVEEHGTLQGPLTYLLMPSDKAFNKASEILGKKYGAFFSNLAGLHNNPTVDIWMVRYFGALVGDAVKVERNRAGRLLSVTDNTKKNLTNENYTNLIRGVVQKVAKEWSAKNGREVSPSAVQAIAWVSVKELFNSMLSRPVPSHGFGEAIEGLKRDVVKSNPEFVAQMDPTSQILKDWVSGSLKENYGEDYFVGLQGETLAFTPKKAYDVDGNLVDFNQPLLNAFDEGEWLTLAASTVKNGELTEREIKAIKDAVAKKDMDTLMNIVLNLNHMPIRELFVNFVKANPLTSTLVMSGNLLNNTAMQIGEEVARTPRFITDLALSLMTGKMVKSGDYVPFFNMGVYKGFARALTVGLPEAWKTLKTGDDYMGTTYEYFLRDRTTGIKVLYPLEMYTNMVFRIQSAMDKPFREFGYARNLEEITRAYARNNKVSYDDAALAVSHDKTLQDIAFSHAVYATFQRDNKFASWFFNVIDNLPPVVKEIGQVTFPYVKTPTNVFLTTLDYAGLGLLKPLGSVAKMKENKPWAKVREEIGQLMDDPNFRDTFTRTIGRGMIGMGLTYAGFALAKAGIVTPAYSEDDRREQAQDALRGSSPGALIIGGQSIPLGRFTPLAFFLTLGAMIYNESEKVDKAVLKDTVKPEDAKYEKVSKSASEGFYLLLRSFGVLNTVTSMVDSAKRGSFIDELPKTMGVDRLLPFSGLLGSISANRDQFERKIDKEKSMWERTKDYFRYKIPGMRETLPPKVEDMLGREITTPASDKTGWRYAMQYVVPTKTVSTNPLIEAIDKYDLNFNAATDEKGIPYSEEWIKKKDKGAYLTSKLEYVMQSPAYANGDDTIKKSMLQDTVKYFSKEYSQDLRTPEEEKYNIDLILARTVFQSSLKADPAKLVGSPIVIKDKETIQNILRDKMDLKLSTMFQKFYDESLKAKQATEKSGKVYRKTLELYDNEELNQWLRENFRNYFMASSERKMEDGIKNYKEFLDNPVQTMVSWYARAEAQKLARIRNDKVREELKAKGWTDEDKINKEVKKRSNKLGHKARKAGKALTVQP